MRFDILRKPAIGNEVVRNLELELCLPVDVGLDIIQRLISTTIYSKLRQFEDLKGAFITASRDHKLKGGKIRGYRPRYLGRVLELSRFLEMVKDRGGLYGEEYIRLVEELMSGSYDDLEETYGDLFDLMGQSDTETMSVLGDYVIWATLNPAHPDGDPFDGMPEDVDEIRGRLGLPAVELCRRDERADTDGDESNEVIGDESNEVIVASLVCIVYQIPDDFELLYPTIADAGWHVYFRSAPFNAHWGVTQPWPRFEKETGRPEIIHKPVPVDRIQFHNVRIVETRSGNEPK